LQCSADNVSDLSSEPSPIPPKCFVYSLGKLYEFTKVRKIFRAK
jgi:hypothetical protein